MECISQSLLTHRQIDCHERWHWALEFQAHVHLFPELSSTSCSNRRVWPIYSHFNCRNGIWQTPWLQPSDLPACPPVFGSPSVTDALNWLLEGAQTKHHRQTTCKLHSRTRTLLQLCVARWSLEKENRGGRQRVQTKSWAECQFTSKTAI